MHKGSKSDIVQGAAATVHREAKAILCRSDSNGAQGSKSDIVQGATATMHKGSKSDIVQGATATAHREAKAILCREQMQQCAGSGDNDSTANANAPSYVIHRIESESVFSVYLSCGIVPYHRQSVKIR